MSKLIDLQRRELRFQSFEATTTGTLKGIAIVTGVPTTIGSGPGAFDEQIAPEAITKALARARDIKMLWNHDANFVLGSTKAGTLTLTATARGLEVEARAPQTVLSDHFRESIKRGDVSGMSFGFRIVDQRVQRGGGSEGRDLHTITDIELYEVSPVTFPAYPTTEISARAGVQANRGPVPKGATPPMKLNELRKKRGDLVVQARAIMDGTADALSDADTQRYDAIMAEADAVGETIARLERLQDEERGLTIPVSVQADANESWGGTTEPANTTTTNRAFVDPETGREFRAFAHGEALRMADRAYVQHPGDDGLDFYRAIAERCTGARLMTPERRALQVDGSTAGGYLAGAGGSLRVFEHARAASAISRAGALSIPINTGQNEVTFATVESDPAMHWTRELETFASSDPTFGSLKLSAKKIIAQVEVSYEAMRAPNIPQLLRSLLGTALAAEIDRVALVGSGAGAEPKGVANTTGVLTGAVTGAVGWDDLLDAYGALQAANVEPNAMILPPAVNTLLAKQKDGEGQYYERPPADLANLTKIVTGKMTAQTVLMGTFADLILCPFGQMEVEIQKALSDRKGAYLIEVCAFFDCGVVWPGHFHKLTGVVA